MATGLNLRRHFETNGVNVMVMGLEQVGKTAIINSLCSMLLNMLMDEAGAFKFMEASLSDMPSLRKLMIGTANAFILTYAADHDASFDYVRTLIDDVQEVKGRNAPIIVVANKSDKDIPVKKRIIADCVITIDYECDHLEVCATSGKNMESIIKFLFDYYGKYLLFPNNDEQEENPDKLEEAKTKSSKNLKSTLRKLLCIR